MTHYFDWVGRKVVWFETRVSSWKLAVDEIQKKNPTRESNDYSTFSTDD